MVTIVLLLFLFVGFVSPRRTDWCTPPSFVQRSDEENIVRHTASPWHLNGMSSEPCDLVWFPLAARTSAHVPSDCREGQWAAGRVLSRYANKARLQIGDDPENQLECAEDELLPRQGPELSVDDIAQLVHVNEPGAMNLLRTRYAQDQIHTHAHCVLVVVNPIKTVRTATGESIYSMKAMREYIAATMAWDQPPPPHIFSTAMHSLHSMQQEQHSCSIILNGLSGSGKTENAKLLLQFLLNVQAMKMGVEGPQSTRKASMVRYVPLGSAMNKLKYAQGDRVGAIVMSSLKVAEVRCVHRRFLVIPGGSCAHDLLMHHGGAENCRGLVTLRRRPISSHPAC